MITLSYVLFSGSLILFTLLYFLLNRKLAIALGFASLVGLFFVLQEELGDVSTNLNYLKTRKWEASNIVQVGPKSFVIVAYFPDSGRYKGFRLDDVNDKQSQQLQKGQEAIEQGARIEGRPVDPIEGNTQDDEMDFQLDIAVPDANSKG